MGRSGRVGSRLLLSLGRGGVVPRIAGLRAYGLGTDIFDGVTPPTFSMTFSLSGQTVPKAGVPGKANCHGKSISALAHQFGGIAAAASALGFSSVDELQEAFKVFCE